MSSVAGVSSNPYQYQPSAVKGGQQFRQDFQDLTQALQSGDLADAQNAFDAMSQLQSGKGPRPDGPMKDDFMAIGKALKSGDLKGAQDALQKLQDDRKAFRAGHAHHHKGTGQTQANGDDSPLMQIAPASPDGDDTDVTTGGTINITA